MRPIIIFIVSYFWIGGSAQNAIAPLALQGKSIYCLKITDKKNIEGTKRSYIEPGAYPYLFKISFEANNVYSKTDKYRESNGRGTYVATAASIILTDGTLKSKTTFVISYHHGNYITLASGDYTYYCLLD